MCRGDLPVSNGYIGWCVSSRVRGAGRRPVAERRRTSLRLVLHKSRSGRTTHAKVEHWPTQHRRRYTSIKTAYHGIIAAPTLADFVLLPSIRMVHPPIPPCSCSSLLPLLILNNPGIFLSFKVHCTQIWNWMFEALFRCLVIEVLELNFYLYNKLITLNSNFSRISFSTTQVCFELYYENRRKICIFLIDQFLFFF